MPALDLPVLTALWLWPALAALAVGRLSEARVRRLLVPIAAAPLALAMLLAGALALGRGETPPLTEALTLGGLRYALIFDPLNSPFVVLTALIGLLVAIYGRSVHKPDFARWARWGLSLQAALLGSQLADGAGLFGLFQAAEIGPTMALVLGWGVGDARRAAAWRAALTLGAAVALWLAGAALAGDHPRAAFALMFGAVALRLPLFPFHGWLPRLVREGPVVALTVYLVGLTVSALALLRFVLPALPGSAAAHADLIVALGLAGVAYGVLQILGRRDLREVIVFATLAHRGFVVAGIFSLSAGGIEGAVLEMLNLGVAAAGLTFLGGFLYVRAGTSDLGALRGVVASRPWLSFAFLALVLASLGMPGTSGFEAIHRLIEGTLDTRGVPLAVVLGVAAVLAGGALLWIYQQLAFEPGDPAPPGSRAMGRTEALIVAALMALVFGLGVEAPTLADALHTSTPELLDAGHADAAGEEAPE